MFPSLLSRCVPRSGRWFNFNSLLLLIGLCLTAAGNALAQTPAAEEPHRLEPGKPSEREMAGGQAHAYLLTLSANQYLYLVVEQRGIDVELTLLGPDGKPLEKVDSPNGAQGPEPLRLLTPVAGSYRLEVRALEKDAKPGRYVARIVELRPAVAQDRGRIAAERIYAEAIALYSQGTRDTHHKAIEKFKEARALFQTIGDRDSEAKTWYNCGKAHGELVEIQEARACFAQALAIWHELGKRREESVILNSLAINHNQAGEMREALDYFNQALQIKREINDRPGIATLLINIANAYHALGENQQALDSCQQALPIWQELKDPEGLAMTLQNMADARYALGDLQLALDLQKRALEIDASDPNALDKMGTYYLALGEPQPALDYYNRALAVWRSIGHVGEGVTLSNIGSVYANKGDVQQALDYYNRAFAIFNTRNDRRGKALALSRMAIAYSLQGDHRRALEAYQQALPLQREAQERVGEAKTLKGIGAAYSALNEKQQAREFYLQALALNQTINSPGGEASTRYDLARIERDLGNRHEARTQIEGAINIIESLRAKITDSDLRSSYFATVQSYYEFYADLLMQMHQQRSSEGFDAAALQVSERARARGLRDLLVEARADIRQGVEPALLEKERNLQQLLNDKAELRVRLLSGPSPAKAAAAVAKELEDVRTQLREVQAQIRQRSPRYAALTQPQPLTVAEMQKQVLDANTILLEYALGQQRSYLWAVTPSKLTSVALPAREKIETQARRLLDLLTARNQTQPGESVSQWRARVARADAQYPRVAAALSRMLLGPVAAQLGKKRLLIVADGALQYIPFAALPAPARIARRAAASPAVPLMVEHEIVSLPSASTLAEMRKYPVRSAAPPKTVAVVADPVFEANDARIKTVMIKTEEKPAATAAAPSFEQTRLFKQELGDLSIRRLPYTRQEAEQISSLAPAAQTLKMLDFKASRATAMSGELSQYRIVHFATHGFFDSQNPELSRIVLSRYDEQGRSVQGSLLAPEVYGLKIPADLVVLSGCKTALGKEVRGEGLGVLTRGFMYAGATRVMASLWSVSDRGTAELMKPFYRRLLGASAQSPAAALRAAQMQLWQTPRWRAPYYWAAFVMQGEW